MRNLLLFLIRYQNFFLFLLLQLICLVLLVRYQHYHQAKVLTFTQEIAGDYYYTTASISDYFQLQAVNDSLQEENAELRNRLIRNEGLYETPALKRARGDTSAEVRLPDISRDTIRTDTSVIQQTLQFEYLEAHVINNSINKRNNYLTLDRGTESGMKAPMGIISSKGVAGIVTNVSQHYAVGISVLHNDFSLSCEIEPIQQIGALSWDGQDPRIVQLDDLPTHLDVEVGQKVVTSPYSQLFPPGVPVGRIIDYRQGAGANFYEIDVRLNTRLRSLQYVYAIKNRLLEEQLNLEKAAKE